MLKRFSIIILLFCFYISASYSQTDSKKDYLKIGGALRFNLAWQNYEQKDRDNDLYIKLDTWFLSVDASKSGFDLSVQYRFYPDSKVHFLHHAYLAYAIDNEWYTKLGVFQKPFGASPSAGHSWWNQMPYYMGFEDTYNIGLGFTYRKNKFTMDAAYFRQAAPKGFLSGDGDTSVGNSRYGYAIVPTDSATIKELDQVNIRLRYQVLDWLELGVSGQLGSIYNKHLKKQTWAISSALHAVIDYQRWNFKTEFINYNYNGRNDQDEKMDIVSMAAYGSAYDVAAKGQIFTTGLAYTIPINRKFVKNIQTYVDYSFVHKTLKGSSNTQMIVPGLCIASGPILTYIDFAIGKNQPWLTSDFGEGLNLGKSNARWNTRMNINIGYYF